MTFKQTNREKLVNELEQQAIQSKVHKQSIESDQKIKGDRHQVSIEKTKQKCHNMFEVQEKNY